MTASPELKAFLKTARRVQRLEDDLAKAREQLRHDLAAARRAGESVSELARRLGVTRARVYQLMPAELGTQERRP